MRLKSILGQGVNYIPHSLRPRIRNVPGIAGLQRWLISRFLSEQPFVHTINVGPAAGLRFEVNLPLDKSIWAGVRQIDSLLRSHEIPPPNVVKAACLTCYAEPAKCCACLDREFSWKRTAPNSRKLARNNFCNWVIRSTALNARCPAKSRYGISSVCNDKPSRRPFQSLAKTVASRS